MKRYEQFKKSFIESVKQELENNGFYDLQVHLQKIDKLNMSYDALAVMLNGSNVSMNISMNAAFEAFQSGLPFEQVVTDVTEAIKDYISQTPIIDLATFFNYELMREKLTLEVVSAERNAALLKNIPHYDMEDMAVVYRILLDENNFRSMSVLVSNHLLESFGITPEQLHKDAMQNAPKIHPVVFKGIREALQEMLGKEAIESLPPHQLELDDSLYMATVPGDANGACVLAYEGFLEQAAEKLGGDFFVIPSSIQEVLLYKDDFVNDYRFLKEMVRQINETELSPDKRLTDNVYHYDSKAHVFETAEKYESRKIEIRQNKKISLDERVKNASKISLKESDRISGKESFIAR